MTPKHFLFFLPVQALMLLASAVQAQTYAYPTPESVGLHGNYPAEPPTVFLPENHTGSRCLAWSPGCMKRSEWAKVCSSKDLITPLGFRLADPNSKSCRDALGVRPIYKGPLPQPRILMPNPGELNEKVLWWEKNKLVPYGGRVIEP